MNARTMATSIAVLVAPGLALEARTAEPAEAEPRKGKDAADAAEKVLTIDLGKDVKMEFVLIPAGSFVMGFDEKDYEKRRRRCRRGPGGASARRQDSLCRRQQRLAARDPRPLAEFVVRAQASHAKGRHSGAGGCSPSGRRDVRGPNSAKPQEIGPFAGWCIVKDG